MTTGFQMAPGASAIIAALEEFVSFDDAVRTLFDASRSNQSAHLDRGQTLVIAAVVAAAMGMEPRDVLPPEIVEEYVAAVPCGARADDRTCIHDRGHGGPHDNGLGVRWTSEVDRHLR